MANVSQKTLHWLYSVLNKEYRDPNRAYSDLARTLEQFPTISPRTDVYTFENGSSALLVHLFGTLPVSFRSITYRFPVEVWIPHTYPYDPPVAYVKPTSDMLVRPGRHVSGEGRVYHPYLAHWTAAWDRSSMVELLSILSDVFSKEPPVISRQQIVDLPQQSARPPPLPAHPREQPGVPHQNSISSIAQPSPPPPPPKRQLGADVDGTLETRPLSRYDAPPPLPITTPAISSRRVQTFQAGPASPPSQSVPIQNTDYRLSMTPPHFLQQQNSAPVGLSHSRNNVRLPISPAGASSQRAPLATLPLQASTPYRQNSVSHSESQIQNVAQNRHQFQATMPSLPPALQQGQSLPTQYQQHLTYQRQPPQPKPSPVDLLDSPFDINLPVSSSANIPAPPIPPNPEKDALLSALSQSITQRLHNDMSQNAASLPLLRSQNEALNISLRTLEAELAQLQALQGTLTSNVSILQSSLREADQCISLAHARAQRGEIPKIDDMLTAPTVVGKQLYDVVCDERGIEAALWALQAALTRGRITTDVWARKTRELSREGFRRKVLTGKISKGLGLEE